MGELLEAILSERIPIREGDKIRTVSRAEATVRALLQKALRGDPKAFSTIMQFCQQNGEFDKEPPKIGTIRHIIVDPRNS